MTKLRLSPVGYVLCFLVAVTFVLMTASTYSLAASQQASLALSNNPTLEYAPDAILVKFKPSTSSTQKVDARILVHGEIVRGYGLVQGLEQIQLGKGQGVERAIEVLQRLSFVEYAEPDYVLRADTNDTYYDLQWGLNNTGQDIRGSIGTPDADIDAEEAWSMSTGDPAFVAAVIDTGVEYTHEDLVNNRWINSGEIQGDNVDNDGNGYIDDIYGWDFFGNDNDPMDEEGHGTHVAGTICAEGNNGLGVSGVVWQCKLMALRFLGPNGGYTSDAIAALNYAVDKGVRVSNNSWGGGGYSQSLYDAIQNAAVMDHLFIAAAGNGGFDGIGDNTDSTPHYPSSYDLDNIISVAATDNRDQLASFSNYGPVSVDLGAPGVDIASTMLSSYYWNSGTSMAAPHVSGVVALILDLHPEWTYAQVRDRIFNTVRPIDALNGKTATGGLVNAYEALLVPLAVPDAPYNLSATAFSDTEIKLQWTDNSTDEDGFKIERSPDGTSWLEIASVSRGSTAFLDSTLAAETLYYYQVRAFNSAGDSAYSNMASATTAPTPTSQEILADGEIIAAGSVSGTYADTWYDDGVVQSITERSSGGRPSSRYSYLQHTWTFQVPAGGATFYLNAWSSPSTDNDSFQFSYSVDNTNYTEMLALGGGDDASGWFSYAFPPGVSGTVYVRVIDSDRTAGNLGLDTVFVDRMYIIVEQEAGEPPSAPTNLAADASVAGQVDLAWIDNSTNEYGFELERSGDGVNWSLLATLPAESEAYTDTTVASETTYHYRVRANNGAGYSSYSNEVSVITLAATDIELSATGYKVKGVRYVDLEWSDTSIPADVYRNNEIIGGYISGGFYTDGPLGKGGGISFVYQVCESGGTVNCSNEAIVIF